MGTLAAEDTDLLYPPFLDRLRAFRAALESRGWVVVIGLGFVPPVQAKRLHALNELDGPPFLSPHCYGLAAVVGAGQTSDGVGDPKEAKEIAGTFGLDAEILPGGGLRVVWPGARDWLDTLRMRWLSTEGGCSSERDRFLRKLWACWEVLTAAARALQSPDPDVPEPASRSDLTG